MNAPALTQFEGLSEMFDLLTPQPADALLGLIGLYRDDPRDTKIDLGVGVFRTDNGATPVMRAVKQAEARLLEHQESKSYIGAEGDPAYAQLLAEVALGHELATSARLTGVQTPGGTGALRLGAELLMRALPDATVWVGTPTWPNHGPIFQQAGLTVRPHAFYNVASAQIDFDAMMNELKQASPGDVLLLHGCCHNPTGASLTGNQWQAVVDFCNKSAVIPFVDLAYQGLGDGVDADAAATRAIFAQCPTAILAYSCDKNFGLYRDRVGALWVNSASEKTAAIVRGNILSLARSLWSMPPDHGGALVRIILEDAQLRADWLAELAEMRDRINGLRSALAAADQRLAFIAKQRGMFAMLPVTSETVIRMRVENGIYMAGNGRINIAGLTLRTIDAFVSSLSTHI